jgi:hypothetical protein
MRGTEFATVIRNDPNSVVVKVDVSSPPAAPMNGDYSFGEIINHKTYMNSGG